MVYFIFIEAVLLVMLVYFLLYFVFYKGWENLSMIGAYECGFDPSSSTRMVFSYKFFLISILFIIFDVEISLMVSIPFFMMKELGMFIFLMFIIILIVGLLYEYNYGSLDWLKYYEG